MGSIAAAGLSTGAFAADPNGLLTSLDTCDAQGKTGLTVSSSDNCLVIDGEVKYEFFWGDYAGSITLFSTSDGAVTVDNDDGVAPDLQDWESDLEAFIRFTASADSDFGTAMAVIKIKDRQISVFTNEVEVQASGDGTGDDTGGAVFDEAYVSVGDATVISAGKKGSIINKGDDEPFNFLGMFNSSEVDKGVLWDDAVIGVADGGHVIQIVSDLGNGVTVKGGLENLNGDGTAIGVLEYAGDSLTAHVTLIATDILDGAVTNWAYHAGGTATFDMFKLRAAVAGDDTGHWNALASAEAAFDMFRIAGSVEAVNNVGAGVNELGFGLSAGADVSDVVTVNAGFRWYDPDTATASDDGWQAALQIIASLTETVTATGEIGVYGTAAAATCVSCSITYGKAELAWAPGGGFTSSVGAELNSEGAYKFTYKAAKTFK